MTPSDRDEPSDTPATAPGALDDYVRAFELAYARRGGADPGAYLPPADDPIHAAVLRELVRVDLEYGWERGRPKGLADYQRDFPALAADPDGLREIAFEEYRLRRQAGQDPSAGEYLARYGVRIDPEVGRFRALSPSRPGTGAINGDGHSLVRTLRPHEKDYSGPGVIPEMPGVGDVFLGFRLIGELGRGAFGRVYLARQGDLADRPVVLKITADDHDESQTLAQLQHENIVPVYSRHRVGRLRAVCMPYLGSVTLRDVVEDLKGLGALPDSGRGLLSSLGRGSARDGGHGPPEPAPRRHPPANPNPPPGPAGPGAPGPADAADNRAMLGRLTYVEAVVWMGARLADGLAHAHERGILHRDMKPANVLLTDDGRPLLLDFNLAEDLKLRTPESAAAAAVGGTLPYMAPEHLAAFRDGDREVDARSDLYAFGVILFEMLTGRPPFPVRDGMRPDVIRAMIADRGGTPPRLRPWNPAVSPAVESVVRRCLDPDPARRYASARELGEDLQRHLAHRPLRHAPDPSPMERASKWARRNRSGLWASAVLAVVGGVVGAALLALTARSDEFARLEARAALARFRERSAHALNLVQTTRGDREPARWREGRDALGAALAEFRGPDDPTRPPAVAPWWERRPAAALPGADRDRVRDEVGELLMVLGYAEARQGDDSADPPARRRLWEAALGHNREAGRSFRPGGLPRSVWSERAGLLRRLGETRAAADASRRADATPPAGAADLTFTGCDLAQRGRSVEALPLLEKAVRVAPDRYWSWLALGNCQTRLRHDEQATTSFSTAVALCQGIPTAWHNRGVVLLHRDRPAQALADFERALGLRPDDPEALTNAALAATRLGRHADALRDLDRAHALGADHPRFYLIRAEVRERSGDARGARRDRREGLRRVPDDERGWVARALARLREGDAPGALADLDKALEVNPDSLDTLVTKAHVLSERLGRTADGLAALDRVVRLYPDRADVWSSRAVLLARLGCRESARSDSERAMESHPLPLRQYQAACVYALTSRREPADRALAVQHLASALRRSCRLVDLAEGDADLAPIRDDPRFPAIIARAKAARAGAAARPVSTPANAPTLPETMTDH